MVATNDQRLRKAITVLINYILEEGELLSAQEASSLPAKHGEYQTGSEGMADSTGLRRKPTDLEASHD